MSTAKKELEVAALENGTVIDHIPSDRLFEVVALLGLDKLSTNITIGNNFKSQKYGKKGIIKIADVYFREEELNKIALIAPNAKINIIRDYHVIEKREVTLPDLLVDIVKCGNPKCITNNEPMKTVFFVTDKEGLSIKCQYCERSFLKKDIEIR